MKFLLRRSHWQKIRTSLCLSASGTVHGTPAREFQLLRYTTPQNQNCTPLEMSAFFVKRHLQGRKAVPPQQYSNTMTLFSYHATLFTIVPLVVSDTWTVVFSTPLPAVRYK